MLDAGCWMLDAGCWMLNPVFFIIMIMKSESFFMDKDLDRDLDRQTDIQTDRQIRHRENFASAPPRGRSPTESQKNYWERDGIIGS